MNDITRAAIISTINSLFPVLNIIGVLSLTGDEISVLMLFINNFITMLFLVIKFGQQSSGTTSTLTASVTTESTPGK